MSGKRSFIKEFKIWSFHKIQKTLLFAGKRSTPGGGKDVAPPVQEVILPKKGGGRGGGQKRSFGDDSGPKKPRFEKDDSLIKVEPALIDKNFNFWNLPKAAKVLLISNVPEEIAKPKPLFHLFR